MASMWMQLVISISVLFCAGGTLADERCNGHVELNPNSCSRSMVLRIPSDRSGAYHFVLNVSMPIYSNENINVELENKDAVRDGTAKELVYVMTHPSCEKQPRVTRLEFNDRVICENNAHQVSPKQPVTRFYYESTNYGIKNTAPPQQNRLPVYSERPYLVFGSNGNSGNSVNSGNAFFNIPGTNTNNGNAGNGLFFTIPGATGNNGNNGNSGISGNSGNSLFSIPGTNANSGSTGNTGQLFTLPGSNNNNGNNGNNGNKGNSGNSGTGIGWESFPNNPFLASLSSPSPNNDFVNRLGGNQSSFNNNPFLTGAFAPPTNAAATPTQRPPDVHVDINAICGLSSQALVQGGSDVQPGEFPWLGGLFARQDRKYLCTVNLVSQRHAITAAHCFTASNDAASYGILWGHPKTSGGDRSYSRVVNLELHPAYNKSTIHDVAVMTLLDRVTFTFVLKPICLWGSRQPEGGASMRGVVAGFGPDYTDLKKVEFPIVSLETCRASNVFFHFATSEFTFCAGTRKSEEGPCKGDSGAGYMQWMEERYYLRGLVSHSLNSNGNCNLNEYIIFSDLSKEMSWVRRTIK